MEWLKKLLSNKPVIGGNPDPDAVSRGTTIPIGKPSLEQMLYRQYRVKLHQREENKKKFGHDLEPPDSRNSVIGRNYRKKMEPLPAWEALPESDVDFRLASIFHHFTDDSNDRLRRRKR